MRSAACILLSTLLWLGAAAAEPPSATLKWQARQESRVYGYLIYRSEKREGPFLRINQAIVHAVAGDDAAIQSYEYVDRDVEPGKTYYYYLDTVGNDGKKARFSSVMSKAVAPRRAAGE